LEKALDHAGQLRLVEDDSQEREIDQPARHPNDPATDHLWKPHEQLVKVGERCQPLWHDHGQIPATQVRKSAHGEYATGERIRLARSGHLLAHNDTGERPRQPFHCRIDPERLPPLSAHRDLALTAPRTDPLPLA
jgi:hypothetical protein